MAFQFTNKNGETIGGEGQTTTPPPSTGSRFSFTNKTGQNISPTVEQSPQLQTARQDPSLWEKVKTKGKPAWNVIDFLLQAPEYAGVGVARATKEKDFDFLNPSDYIKGGQAGLKRKETLPGFLKALGYPDAVAYGVGLPASMMIPSVPVGKALGLVGKGSKALGITEKISSVASKIDKEVPIIKKFADAFRYKGEIKSLGEEGEAYIARLDELNKASRTGVEKAEEMSKFLSEGLSQGQQIRLGQIIKGGVSTIKTEEGLRQKAEIARKVIDELSLNLIAERMIGKETQIAGTSMGTDLLNTLTRSFKKPDQTLGQVEKGWKTGNELIDSLLQTIVEKQPAHISPEDVGMGVKATLGGAPEVEDVTNLSKQFGQEGVTIPGTEISTSFPRTTIAEEGKKILGGTEQLGVKLKNVAEGLPQAVEKRIILPIEHVVKEAIQGGAPITDNMVKTIEENLGTYMPQLYRAFEKNPDGTIKSFMKGGGKMVLDRLKNKKDIPDAVKASLGQILEPAYPVGKGIAQVTDMIEKSKFLRWVGDNFGQIEDATGTLTRLPEDKALGMLAGKYVPKAIADDILPIFQKSNKSEVMKAIEGTYMKLLGAWKVGKVLLSPAARGRNQMVNMLLMDTVGGMSLWNPANLRYWAEAGISYKNKDDFFKLVKKETDLLDHTFYGNELAPFVDDFVKQTNPNAFGRFVETMKKGIGGSYQAQEEWGKLVLTKYHYDKLIKTMGSRQAVKDAAKIAEDALFNYDKIPEIIRKLKNLPWGYPFLTFSYFAVPRTIKAFIKNPSRFGRLSKLKKAVEQKATENFGEPDEELLPDYMKEGNYMRLPFKDPNGQELYLDLNYITPWGDLTDRVADKLLPSNPAFTLVADLSRNRSGFTGREIWDPELDKDKDGNFTKTGMNKVGKYLYQTIMPPTFPGGTSVDKLVSAWKQRPDYFGRVRDLPITLTDVFLGLKAQPVDPEVERKSQQIQKSVLIKRIRNKIRSTNQDKRLTDQDKRDKVKELQLQLQQVVKEGGFSVDYEEVSIDEPDESIQ